MIKQERGFTLVELLITMVIFILVIAAGSQIFTGLLSQFKQQSRIAETNIEGIVGLEILRQDIEHAGYGLPWIIPAGVTYSETTSSPASTFNDASNLPRAILSGNNMTYSSPNNVFNGSDYLVIKSVNVAGNDVSQRWTTLGSAWPFTRTWNKAGEDFANSDRVIVLSPGGTGDLRTLRTSGTTFYTIFGNVTSSPWVPDASETLIVYGINDSSASTPQMPFNRADYYIWRGSTNPATDDVPDRCAPNTGVLRKAVLNHSGTFQGGILPLLDCVTDMQVIYGIDTDATIDGTINCYANDPADALATIDAENIRNRIKEVRVYLLAHEGQYDRTFTYNPPIPPSSVRVGEPSASLPGGSCTGVAVLGRDFNLSGITNWQNYRWKLYTMVVKPNNLR